jgi:tRNA acetyltransferase TAN1
MKPTETFNMLITLQGQKDEVAGEELIGIEEIELALQNHEPVLNVKESNFPNVILIDLSMKTKDAVRVLRDTQTTVISKVVPIEIVTRTRVYGILEKTVHLAGQKFDHGETFVVRCDLRGRKYIESKEELINNITEELSEKLNLSLDENDPTWVVQVEVVGENTGISVLKPDEILKKF